MCCLHLHIPSTQKVFDLSILGGSFVNNTWEPKENLDCHDLIKEFEKNYAAKKTTDSKRKTPAATSSAADKKKRGEGERPRGFGRGLDPERIIGATDSSG